MQSTNHIDEYGDIFHKGTPGVRHSLNKLLIRVATLHLRIQPIDVDVVRSAAVVVTGSVSWKDGITA